MLHLTCYKFYVLNKKNKQGKEAKKHLLPFLLLSLFSSCETETHKASFCSEKFGSSGAGESGWVLSLLFFVSGSSPSDFIVGLGR